MKNRLPALGVALLLVGGVGVAGAATATASPLPTLTQTCVPSDGVTDTEDSGWLLGEPDGDGWTLVETRTVVDAEATYGTEYLVAFYQQTGWVLTAPEGEGWVQVAERTVIDQEYVPGEYEQTGWVTESPGDGWKQIAKRWVVDVEAQPAQGTPTIVIPNPDYVPGWTETVEHPAEYVTLVKWVKNGGKGEQWLPEGQKPSSGKWTKTGKTKQKKVKDAWTETIEHPAQGEPTIEVDNPDYVPAVEEQGHWEYKFARHVPAIPEESHQEYKFAKHIPATWMTEVPTGDGWKVKDEREVLLTEEESHDEYRYERTVVVEEPTVCPPPVDDEEEDDTEEIPVETDDETPVDDGEDEEQPAPRPAPQQRRAPAPAPAEASTYSLAETGASVGLLGLGGLVTAAGAGLVGIRRRLSR